MIKFIKHKSFPRIACAGLIVSGLTFASPSQAGITFEPFASTSSTKQIKPDKIGKTSGSATETETIKQRTTYGLRASIGFLKILKFQLGIGTNKLTTTSKTSQAVDEYGEVDFASDLDMDTSNPDKEVTITEVQKKGTATLVIDPSFSVFLLRAKAGMVATQREFTKAAVGEPTVTEKTPVTYKPTVGFGAGIKLSPKMYFMAEYSLFLYKYPEKTPFEREVTVSYGLSI